MVSTPGKIPEFQQPTETTSPEVTNLLTDRLYVEDGIDYSQYKPLRPCKNCNYLKFCFQTYNLFNDLNKALYWLAQSCFSFQLSFFSICSGSVGIEKVVKVWHILLQ